MKKLGKYLAIALLIVNTVVSSKGIIYIHPGSWGDLFRKRNLQNDPEELYKPISDLKTALMKLGYRVKQTSRLKHLNNIATIICFDVPLTYLGHLKTYQKEKLILFL